MHQPPAPGRCAAGVLGVLVLGVCVCFLSLLFFSLFSKRVRNTPSTPSTRKRHTAFPRQRHHFTPPRIL